MSKLQRRAKLAFLPPHLRTESRSARLHAGTEVRDIRDLVPHAQVARLRELHPRPSLILCRAASSLRITARRHSARAGLLEIHGRLSRVCPDSLPRPITLRQTAASAHQPSSHALRNRPAESVRRAARRRQHNRASPTGSSSRHRLVARVWNTPGPFSLTSATRLGQAYCIPRSQRAAEILAGLSPVALHPPPFVPRTPSVRHASPEPCWQVTVKLRTQVSQASPFPAAQALPRTPDRCRDAVRPRTRWSNIMANSAIQTAMCAKLSCARSSTSVRRKRFQVAAPARSSGCTIRFSGGTHSSLS